MLRHQEHQSHAHRTVTMRSLAQDTRSGVKRLKSSQIITGIPFWTVTIFFQKIRSNRAGWSRTLTFSFGFLLLLWIVFHTTLVSSGAWTICCPLYATSTVYFPFARRLVLGCKRAFQVLSHKKRNASHELPAPSIEPPSFFESAVVSRSPFWSGILGVQRQQRPHRVLND